MTDALPDGLRPVFRAVAGSVVPEVESLTSDEWAEVEAIAAATLATRPAVVRRQLAAFLRLLQAAPIVRHGRVLTRLASRDLAEFLSMIERSPLPLLRRGFWGVRTLVLVAYYSRPAVHEAIGYRSHPSGWAARGGTVATIPLRTGEIAVEPR
jgi:hypothetical protein